MSPLFVAVVAIVAWALVQMTRNRTDGASTASLELRLREVADALEASEAERARLTERVQNLEAIVTTETYELARHDPAQAAARLKLPEEGEEESPEAQAARLARRMRS